MQLKKELYKTIKKSKGSLNKVPHKAIRNKIKKMSLDLKKKKKIKKRRGVK